jgi:rare lipoprotein A
VNFNRITKVTLLVAMAMAAAACFSTPPRRPQPAALPPPVPPPPLAAQTAHDAVPRVEPRSRSGNPPFYVVFGKRYFVLASSVGYRERGVASWYGPGFHSVKTSIGESYDMYGMSAAHKTLPLPAYVRVTNLQNARSVVVRVNDRGPFVGNRIIDLSYTAAAKLDMLRNGTAMVEVRAIDPTMPEENSPTQSATLAGPASPVTATAPPASGAPPAAAAAEPLVSSAGLFVQAGAFADPANAERLAARLRGGRYGNVFVRDDQIAGRKMYRVRIGPVSGVPEFDRVIAALERAGVNDAHLALD